MKKLFLRISAVITSAAITLSLLSGCSSSKATGRVNTKKYTGDVNDESVAEGKVCENDRFVLNWNNIKKCVYIFDKSTSKTYCTVAEGALETVLGEDGMPIKNNPQTESAVTVYYYDQITLSEKSLTAAVDAVQDGDVYTEKTENGLRVTYDFMSMEITVPVEYTIEKDYFTATVITEEITDNGENYVTGVALSPFLCSVKNDSPDSWLFLPDGSGSLLSTATTDLVGTQGSMKVYGVDPSIQSMDLNSYRKQINLPVYGMKSGDKAVLGIITSGAEGAELSWNIGSQNIGYSSVYPFFRIRGYNLIHAPEGFTTTEVEIKVFDEYINTTPLSVSFYPLTGEKADYNGMAETYRNYLTENGQLQKTEAVIPTVSLKLLGGAESKKYTFGIPRTVLYSLTTVKDAEEIVNYFSEELDNDFLVNLIGFGKSGLDFGKIGGGFKVASSLGSKKQLKSLSGFCNKNGIPIFMDFDIVAFNESGAGFTLRSNAAALPNGQNTHDVRKDFVTRKETGYRYNLLSRASLEAAAQKAENAAESYGLTGVSLSSLSNTSYSDYKTKGAAVCGDMAKQTSELIKNSKLPVLSSGANGYAACASSFITDVPTGSSGLDFEITYIPFYAMVFRGYAAMSGESVNLSSNERNAFLRCLESGVALTYTLYNNFDSSLVTIDQSALYGSEFESNKQRIVESCKEYKNILDKLSNAGIEKHYIAENGIRVTEFDNGVKIAINETKTDKTINGITVKAMDYAVIKEG